MVIQKNVPEAFAWVARAASILSLIIILGGFGWLLKDNLRARGVIADMAGIPALVEKLEKLDSTLNELKNGIAVANTDAETRSKIASIERDDLMRRLKTIEQAVNTNLDPKPPLKFMQFGNSVEGPSGEAEAHIGDTIWLEWSFIKVRDCGQPFPNSYIIDKEQVTAHLLSQSTLDESGRGVVSPIDPDKVITMRYTVKIPEDKGLTPGAAKVWIVLVYDEKKCPNVDPVSSFRLTLNLLPAR